MLLTYIRGVADMDNNCVVLSLSGSVEDVDRSLAHEMAHLCVRDVDHGPLWRRTYERFCGILSVATGIIGDCANLSKMFRDIGYMPNIGNISGIQNIY